MQPSISEIGLLLLFLGLFLLLCGCASKGPLTVQQAGHPLAQIDARGLFLENCTICHGKNGRAHTFHGVLVGAQNLTLAEFQDNTSDAEIMDAITTGPSYMPAFGKKLSPPEIQALAQYVRTFKQPR
jgi:cytochrome c6